MKKEIDLQVIEQELKKRLSYPYDWKGKKQTDLTDRQSRFIYSILSFEELLQEIERRFAKKEEYDYLLNYSLNRWYNFWSAMAVEQVFASLPGVVKNKGKDREVDFYLAGMPFDHKTTVFPKGFKHSLRYCRLLPEEMVKWMYENQSGEQRQHYRNRIFIVLYAPGGGHWKLKAEIAWLKKIIEDYMKDFAPEKLLRFSFEAEPTHACVIWAVKQPAISGSAP